MNLDIRFCPACQEMLISHLWATCGLCEIELEKKTKPIKNALFVITNWEIFDFDEPYPMTKI